MRKLIFSILLASAAASPALAQDHGRWHNDEAQGDRAQAHEQRQEERQQAREQRGNGGGEAARVQQQAPAPQAQAQPQFEARRQQWQGRQQNDGQQQQQQWQGRRFDERNNAQAQVQAQQIEQQRQFDRAGRGFEGRQRDQAGQWQGQRYQGQNYQGQTYQGQRYQGQNYQGQNYQGQRYAGRQTASNWNRDWRNDRRYDWRRYRDSHRSIFRLGIYYDPFGYGYRRFDIGYQFYPTYYSQQYWIDPALYGLPYPPPGAQWVRYWNDAVLVDTYSGQVIDVIRDFFW